MAALSTSHFNKRMDQLEHMLFRIERKMRVLEMWEFYNMALGQDILDAVAAETSVVDSFIELVKQLVANNTVSAEQGAAILKAIGDEKQKVADAIVANTPPAPPTP